MISLKIMGVALIIGSSGLYGLMGARRIANRVQHLKNVRLAMNFLEKEITSIHTPLPRALVRTAQFSFPPVNSLFIECARRLQEKNGLTAGEAWFQGLEQLRASSALNREDLELLSSVALQIGRTDADEQKKFFKLIQEELQLQEQKAAQDADSGRRVWAYGGFILGTMVVLMLI